MLLDRFGQSNKLCKKSYKKCWNIQFWVLCRSSRGRPENVLGISGINLPGTSLERQIGTFPGRSNRIFSGLPGNVGRGRSRDVLGTNICRLVNVSYSSCISKINSTLTDNADDLDIVMPMYTLLEYGQNYSMTWRSLWDYYRDEIDDVDDKVSDGKSFEYKTEMVEKTPDIPVNKGDANRPPVSVSHVEVALPIIYPSSFRRSFDWPLTNY